MWPPTAIPTKRVPAKGSAYAVLDPNLKLVPGEAAAYGKALGAVLFANEEIRGGFQKARDSIQDKGDASDINISSADRKR